MKEFAGPMLLFLLVWAIVIADAVINTTQPSCVPAHPVIKPSEESYHCRPYQYSKNGFCKNRIGQWNVYGSLENQKNREDNLQRVVIGKKMLEGYITIKVRKSCLKVFNDTYCRYSFPKCDLTSNIPLPKPVCRESCEDVYKMCDKEINLMIGFNMRRHQAEMSGNSYPLYWDVVNCSIVKYRNGGDNPECYFSRHLNNETDKLEETECYYGNGLGYRGNVSVTQSGHVCQSWSSQCPHRHDHPLSEYPELVNASNWCRNPGGQGPNGPWCYTTNSSVRWEYCDVEKCPDPAPTKSPIIVQAYSFGSSKISITWDPVPLPFIHGQPRGSKIKVSRFGKELMVNTTGPNTTDFEFKTLQPLTNYSLSVLAFNDVGDGPWSRPVYVKTMPKNSVTVKYLLTLKRRVSSNDLLNRKTNKYIQVSSQVKKMVVELFGKRPTAGYSIHQIKIKRFVMSKRSSVRNSSFQVEFDITAELKDRPSWSASQDITGRILHASKVSKKLSKTFKLSSLIAAASPPPPANLTNSDVQTTSVMVGWSAPLYHRQYRITNYTVYYKKANTDMSYYGAVKVNSNITKVPVKNLDSGTEYLMRVESINAHGSERSEAIRVETRHDSTDQKIPILEIVLPFVSFIVLMVVAGFIFGRRKRKENKEMQEKLQKLLENPYDSPVDWFEVLKIKITKQWWEIPRDDLLIDKELGSGAFGVVMKCYLTEREEGKNENRIACAVKMLKENPTERELRDLCNEINIMSSVGDHPNLVSLIGACTINGPLWLVVKFAPNGCLLDYLKENRPEPEYQNTSDVAANQPKPKPIREKERMRFAYEIAQGMAHLERHRYVHRDLAARNVLLGKNMVAMVSDFGMSRDVYEIGVYENTSGGILPVRWMALESLQDYTYTSKSDVWSYGVLLWEIENGGLMPYAGMTGLEVVERLRQGYRLERPNNTSRDIYEIMWQCWNPEPNQRPTFADLVYKIGGLINLSQDYEVKCVPDNNARHNDGYKLEPKEVAEQLPSEKGFIVLKDVNVTDRDFEM